MVNYCDPNQHFKNYLKSDLVDMHMNDSKYKDLFDDFDPGMRKVIKQEVSGELDKLEKQSPGIFNNMDRQMMMFLVVLVVIIIIFCILIYVLHKESSRKK